MTAETNDTKVYLDTRDRTLIAEIATLQPCDESLADLFNAEDMQSFLRRSDTVSYRRWRNEAIVVARAGVRPAPSHTQYGTRRYVSLSGAFLDVTDLATELSSTSETPNAELSYSAAPGTSSSSWSQNDLDAGQESELPVVIAGVALPDSDTLEIPFLPSGPHWTAVTAQTAGLACHQPRFIGVPVLLHEHGRMRAREISRFCDSELVDGHNCIGIGGLDYDEAGAYMLHTWNNGVRAEHSYPALEEGCYPVDLTIENLEQFGTLTGPDAALVEAVRRGEIGSWRGSRWGIFVFGPNCD